MSARPASSYRSARRNSVREAKQLPLWRTFDHYAGMAKVDPRDWRRIRVWPRGGVSGLLDAEILKAWRSRGVGRPPRRIA